MLKPRLAICAKLSLACVLIAGCQSESEQREDQPVLEKPHATEPERPQPPSLAQTQQTFVDTIEPMLAAKLHERLNTAQVKQKLVLAVSTSPGDGDPVAPLLIQKLKSDASITEDFGIVETAAAHEGRIPPGLSPTGPERLPDGTATNRPIYNPDDIYVLDLRYKQDGSASSNLTLTLRCRVTHPQTRELILQYSPTYHQAWDGSAWRLQP